jgi:hypothetical protein
LRAWARANNGQHEEALQLANAAVEMTATVEAPLLYGFALTTLADVHDAAGNERERDDTLRLAVALYQAKGDIVTVGELENRLKAEAGA